MRLFNNRLTIILLAITVCGTGPTYADFASDYSAAQATAAAAVAQATAAGQSATAITNAQSQIQTDQQNLTQVQNKLQSDQAAAAVAVGVANQNSANGAVTADQQLLTQYTNTLNADQQSFEGTVNNYADQHFLNRTGSSALMDSIIGKTSAGITNRTNLIGTNATIANQPHAIDILILHTASLSTALSQPSPLTSYFTCPNNGSMIGSVTYSTNSSTFAYWRCLEKMFDTDAYYMTLQTSAFSGVCANVGLTALALGSGFVESCAVNSQPITVQVNHKLVGTSDTTLAACPTGVGTVAPNPSGTANTPNSSNQYDHVPYITWSCAETVYPTDPYYVALTTDSTIWVQCKYNSAYSGAASSNSSLKEFCQLQSRPVTCETQAYVALGGGAAADQSNHNNPSSPYTINYPGVATSLTDSSHMCPGTWDIGVWLKVYGCGCGGNSCGFNSYINDGSNNVILTFSGAIDDSCSYANVIWNSNTLNMYVGFSNNGDYAGKGNNSDTNWGGVAGGTRSFNTDSSNPKTFQWNIGNDNSTYMNGTTSPTPSFIYMELQYPKTLH